MAWLSTLFFFTGDLADQGRDYQTASRFFDELIIGKNRRLSHPLEREQIRILISRHSNIELFGHMHKSLTKDFTGSNGKLFDYRQNRSPLGKIDLHARAVYVLRISYFENACEVWTIRHNVNSVHH